MAITVKHKFVSAIPDAGDTTIVQPSNWNDTHDLTGFGTSATLDAGVANGVATLDSSGTVPLSQIPALGDLNYQGTWNATTNSPTLTSSVGTKGFYYVVSVAGTTNLNGITDWQVGDWAVYNGSAWQKIDNTDAVTSVNGYTGTVVLTAADVNAVPYTGATGAVDLNAKSLVNVSNLGINTTTVPTIKIRAVGDNNSGSRIAMRGYSSDANSSSIRVSKYRGTVASPQAPLSGDSLGKFELAGYGTTSSDSYPQSSLEGVATENWGATARGAKAVVKVTPNTTTTQVTALTINQDSTAVFANTVTANGTLLTGNTGTVTSVAATAGTGISISGSPITTSGTLTITNTAPDQTVALTAGTGISTSGTYPNFTITNTAPSSGGTVTSVTGTAPVVSSGGNTPAISMAAANTTTNGYLTSTDWNTFNGKSNTNGTVTSVAALTLGTTGTDLSSTVANGTTTPVITLQVPTASATNRGALSATDWTTFNNKGSGTVTSVGITAPSIFTVGGSPVTGSGTLALTYSGTALPLANGGTGATSAPAANASLFGFTTTATSATPLVLTNTSSVYQLFTGSTAQTVTLPVTSTLTAGWTFHIVNNSTQNITVNSSGANLVCTVIPNTTSMVTCILITGTTAASWEFGFTDFGAITGTGSVVMSTSPTLVTPVLGTPASGTVTNLTGTASININGTVGATTASTGAFTSLAYSTTLTGGTGIVNLGSGQFYKDTTGNVGVGVTPEAWTNGKVVEVGALGCAVFGSGANDTVITSGVYYSTGYKFAATNSLGSSTYEQYNGNHIYSYVAPASHTIGNTATLVEAMRIDSSGRLLVGLTSANTSGSNFQVSQGITFPATQSASSDANTLDDYEEGSWTPVITDGTNNATMAGGGKYTKVGRAVTVTAFISLSSLGSVSGNLRISGFPFTNATGTGFQSGSADPYFYGLLLVAGSVPAVFLDQGSSIADCKLLGSTNNAGNLTSTQLTASGTFAFNFTYQTT